MYHAGMRRLALVCWLGAACGGGGGGGPTDAPAGVVDAPPPGTPDARTRPVAACEHRTGTSLTLRQVVPDRAPREAAVLLTSPPFDPRQFIVYRDGLILISEGEVLRPEPFLDVNALVTGFQHEQGLLGLVFHPDYEHNRTFYVFYASTTANVLARYRTSDDPYVADPASAEIMLSIPDLYENHNGGMMAFGPDGYLYIGTGDGGGSSDPANAAENPDNLLGKILRLDVDHPAGGLLYGIPADNPFVVGGGAPEVYAYGLRNP
jgi:glucose/arabinose dehydrogenase